MRTIAAGLALSVGVAGCVFSPPPYQPTSWPRRPVAAADVADRDDRPRLQVLVTYGPLMASHTAVRIAGPRGRVVFWDPAGDYGRFDLELDPAYAPFPLGVIRTRDLILENPPDLTTYVRFRWALSDSAVEVFEWDLSATEARRLQEVLVRGRDPDRPAVRFATTTMPPLCTLATSHFLRRFGATALALRTAHFFPHGLAGALYEQAPARVLVFVRADRTRTSLLTPPGRGPGAPAGRAAGSPEN